MTRAILVCIKLLAWLQAWLYARLGMPVWRSQDGRIMRLCDMGDRHLQNSIAMVQRARAAGEKEQPIYRHLLRERTRRWARGRMLNAG